MGKKMDTKTASEYLLERHGVKLSATTLLTWRTRYPQRLRSRKIGGRRYYDTDDLDRFVDGDDGE